MARRERYQVVGSDGWVDVPVAFLPGRGDTTIRVRSGQDERSETIAGADEYQLMVEHFADCARDRATLRYPVQEAAANMRAIAALLRSARNGGRPEPVME
jgi:predicted dehydrogenase